MFDSCVLHFASSYLPNAATSTPNLETASNHWHGTDNVKCMDAATFHRSCLKNKLGSSD